jgi:2-polyprenyl-3-methyl-5-hydroxy-6-metoxy-1,4-benzoquinol methylase
VLFEHAAGLKAARALANVEFRYQAVEGLDDDDTFDLVVLDNVFEHLPNQPLALQKITRSLRPGGALLLIVPNKLWPLEVHYGLPFLSYLPLPLANWYLRVTGRGADYTDASYAPTFRGLNHLLGERPELTYRYVLPADVALATMGTRLHYRLGVAALRRWPWLWPLAKIFVVVAVKLG